MYIYIYNSSPSYISYIVMYLFIYIYIYIYYVFYTYMIYMQVNYREPLRRCDVSCTPRTVHYSRQT